MADRPVSLGNLAGQLRHEAAASPKKAVCLGLLGVVAVWFWVPLAWGWIAPNDGVPEATAAKPPATDAAKTDPGVKPPPSAPAAAAKTTTETKNEPRYPWYQLVRWMDSDPRTSAAEPLLVGRDPFQTTEKEVEIIDPTTIDVAKELGLQLSTTIVGARRSTACVHGRWYEVGDVIRSGQDRQGAAYELLQVSRQQIVVGRDGQRFAVSVGPFVDPEQIRVVKRSG